MYTITIYKSRLYILLKLPYIINTTIDPTHLTIKVAI